MRVCRKAHPLLHLIDDSLLFTFIPQSRCLVDNILLECGGVCEPITAASFVIRPAHAHEFLCCSGDDFRCRFDVFSHFIFVFYNMNSYFFQ